MLWETLATIVGSAWTDLQAVLLKETQLLTIIIEATLQLCQLKMPKRGSE